MNLSPSRIHDLVSDDIVYLSVIFSSQSSFLKGEELCIKRSDFSLSGVEKAAKNYTYKALKSANLKEGDLIVVPTGSAQTLKVVLIVKILDPDELVENESYDVRWAFNAIDVVNHIKLEESEQEWLKSYKQMQTKSLRAQLLRAQFGDDVKMLAPRGTKEISE